MLSLLDNLLASGLLGAKKTTEDKLSSLLSGLAPLVAQAPAEVAHSPQHDIPDLFPPPRPRPAPSYNPLAGLGAGITPQFLDFLSRKRYMRESVLFPAFSKKEGRS